jgi:hypothetical protein
LRRDVDVAVIERGRRSQSPEGVDQVRTRERHEVGSARRQDRVRMVGLVNVADRHRRQLRLVAKLVRERRLEHAPVHRLGLSRSLARGHIDQVGAFARESFADIDRVVGSDSLLASPVGGGDPDRHIHRCACSAAA